LKRHRGMPPQTVCSIVASGLVLAGAFVTAFPTDARAQEKQADLKESKTPPDRRAELMLRQEARNRPNDWIGEVVFTPDGRRVAAVAMRSIVIWNAATGDEEDSLERESGSSADCLAVSPDGRWLAVTNVGRMRVFDINPAGR
jgi:WD40 repeat protein